MPRSRSRSPARRDRERRRSRSRERRHRHRRSRSPRSRRSRSHSPHRRSRSASPNRSERRSHSREREGVKGSDKSVSLSSSHLANKDKSEKADLKALPKDEQDMMKLMGFSTFETTKNKKVEGNDIYVTNLTRKRRYRQYMNRRGGFNRPLDFIA